MDTRSLDHGLHCAIVAAILVRGMHSFILLKPPYALNSTRCSRFHFLFLPYLHATSMLCSLKTCTLGLKIMLVFPYPYSSHNHCKVSSLLHQALNPTKSYSTKKPTLSRLQASSILEAQKAARGSWRKSKAGGVLFRVEWFRV